MTRPWRCLDAVTTDEGVLKCLVRGDDGDERADYMITIDGRVLMVSHAARSEQALAQLAHDVLGEVRQPRVLVGGLGMGYTLRAALDAWPDAVIDVCEVNPVVVGWCRGPLSSGCGDALADVRVTVLIEDVADVIDRSAAGEPKYDAILLDLYEGPNEASRGEPSQRHYTSDALNRARAALRSRGVLAVWSETADAAFEKRLQDAGLRHERHHPDRTARRHAVYLAKPVSRRRS